MRLVLILKYIPFVDFQVIYLIFLITLFYFNFTLILENSKYITLVQMIHFCTFVHNFNLY